MTRIYRKKYYEKIFDRELRFLIEYFGTGKAKNRALLKGLKKIRRDQILGAIENYQRKIVCDYMIYTRQININKLKVRIKFNEMTY